MLIKKGQMIIVESGEYEDRCIDALVIAVKEFNIKEKQTAWEAAHTEIKPVENSHRRARKVKGVEFVPWLILQGFIVDIYYVGLHTGSYGEVEINIDKKA